MLCESKLYVWLYLNKTNLWIYLLLFSVCTIFAPRIGSVVAHRCFGLKGNQVKVLDSPAAVKLVKAPWH